MDVASCREFEQAAGRAQHRPDDDSAWARQTVTMLTNEQIESWTRDGFLVLERLVSDEACDALLRRADELVEAFEPETHSSVFSTDEQTRTSDEVFLASGGRVDCFFEDEAFDAEGNLIVDKRAALNKIGHAQHDLDPVFDAFSRAEPLPALVADLGLGDPKLLQSMLIFKHPRIGGEVTSHQDATFLWTEPNTVVGLWFALADATLENGCLWAQPGGHRSPVRSRFRRADVADPGAGTVFDELDTTPLPALDDASMVPLEVPKGSCVVLHGALPHGSLPNRSDIPRPAYSVHLIDGDADYPADNWLQRPELPLRGF